MPVYKMHGRRFSALGLKEYLADEISRYGEAKWITIGGHPEGGKQHAGGTPVQVSGDKIVKGPAELQGHSLAEIATEQEPKAPPVDPNKQVIPSVTMTQEQIQAMADSPVWANLAAQCKPLKDKLSMDDKLYLNEAAQAYFAQAITKDELKKAFEPYGINVEAAFGATWAGDDLLGMATVSDIDPQAQGEFNQAAAQGLQAEEATAEDVHEYVSGKWTLKNSATDTEFRAQLKNLGWDPDNSELSEDIQDAMGKYFNDGDLVKLYQAMKGQGDDDIFKAAWQNCGLSVDTLNKIDLKAALNTMGQEANGKKGDDKNIYVEGSKGSPSGGADFFMGYGKHWIVDNDKMADKIGAGLLYKLTQATDMDPEDVERIEALVDEFRSSGDVTDMLKEMSYIDGNPVSVPAFINVAREIGLDDDQIAMLTNGINMPKPKIPIKAELKEAHNALMESVVGGEYKPGAEKLITEFGKGKSDVASFIKQLNEYNTKDGLDAIDVLKKHGIEVPAIKGEGGQFGLPGMVPPEGKDEPEKIAIEETAADVLAKFIAKKSPSSTGSGTEFVEDASKAKLMTPDGEEIKLFNMDESHTFPHASSTSGENLWGTTQEYLDSIPKKMGWDDLTTAEWNQLTSKVGDQSWQELEDEEQTARDDFHAEQEAEQEAEEEESQSDGYEWYGETSYHSHTPNKYYSGEYADLPQDNVDQTAMTDVLRKSEEALDDHFNSGQGNSTIADNFWRYAGGNWGSLNDQILGRRHDQDELYDSMDEMIDEVGVWDKPMTVFRAAYGKPESKAKFLKGVNHAMETGGVFKEQSWAHTSISCKKSMEGFASSHGCLMVIKSKTGAWIAPYTQHSNELEILKKRKTRYRPIKVYERDIDGKDTTVVECEELLPEELVALRAKKNQERQERKAKTNAG